MEGNISVPAKLHPKSFILGNHQLGLILTLSSHFAVGWYSKTTYLGHYDEIRNWPVSMAKWGHGGWISSWGGARKSQASFCFVWWMILTSVSVCLEARHAVSHSQSPRLSHVLLALLIYVTLGSWKTSACARLLSNLSLWCGLCPVAILSNLFLNMSSQVVSTRVVPHTHEIILCLLWLLGLNFHMKSFLLARQPILDLNYTNISAAC